MIADSETLKRLVDEVIAPRADEVDRVGTFPREVIDHLAGAGVLGMMSAADVGGGGKSLAEAAETVEALAGACGSTAMVLVMHFAATAILEAHGDDDVRRDIAAGRHLTTLAFSETGSRSDFWAPTSTARRDGAGVVLTAEKSWVTSAGKADSYVWSSQPVEPGSGAMSLWHVPAGAAGLRLGAPFDGFGLRGNASRAITAEKVRIPEAAMLGADGTGLEVALATALPHFLVLSAAFSVGIMRSAVRSAAQHLTATHLTHLGETLADQKGARIDFADLLTRTDAAKAFLDDTLTALASGRDDAMVRVLQVKSVAAEAAADVTDGVMRLCGGSAFRREMGVERRFRDSRAARVMAPTTQALRDFTGRAALGLPLF